MSEFRFTNDQWRVFQDLPVQGISHRHWLEHVVNSWLAEHDRQVAEKALLDVADDVVARWEDTGLGAVGVSWLRARAEAYRGEKNE